MECNLDFGRVKWGLGWGWFDYRPNAFPTREIFQGVGNATAPAKPAILDIRHSMSLG